MNDIKLIMTLLVRDEEDIIKENIDFHLSQGVDFFIVTDNLSEDSTSQILHDYEKKGVLHYIYEPKDDYSQHEWVTRMARMAYTKYGADWVINNDADEFWWPQKDTLKNFFKAIPAEYNIVECDRHNFVPVAYSGKFYSHMIYKENISINYMGEPLPPKVAHRGDSEVVIHQGNHKVSGFKNPAKLQGGIDILHFPIRTYDQFLNKITKGGAAYERNRDLKKSTGKTWRMLYQVYKKDKNLRAPYKKQCYNRECLKQETENGNIIKDFRLKNYLLDLYKN